MTDPAASTPAAFFDLDNTVVRGTSLFQLGKGLYARKYFSVGLIVHALILEAAYRITGAEHAAHISQARESALSIIKGRSVQDVADHAHDIFSGSFEKRIWPQTAALVAAHLAAGRPVWLVTAAPVEVADLYVRHLGLTGAIGTVAERRDGFYTGRLTGGLVHGPAKAEAVRTLAAERGYDLDKSSAYSDSRNDLPLLNLVGNPHAVNPDRGLKRHARAAGWTVHDFRSRARRRALTGTVVGTLLVTAWAVYRARR